MNGELNLSKHLGNVVLDIKPHSFGTILAIVTVKIYDDYGSLLFEFNNFTIREINTKDNGKTRVLNPPAVKSRNGNWSTTIWIHDKNFWSDLQKNAIDKYESMEGGGSEYINPNDIPL